MLDDLRDAAGGFLPIPEVELAGIENAKIFVGGDTHRVGPRVGRNETFPVLPGIS